MIFDCRAEPTGVSYRQLIEWVERQANIVGFVIDSSHVDLPARKSLAHFDGALRSDELVTEWPGTRKMGPSPMPAELRRYELTPDVKGYLLTAAAGLFDWDHPALPRDLHFITGDGVVILGSVTTERDAWLDLTEELWQNLAAAAPEASQLFAPGPG